MARLNSPFWTVVFLVGFGGTSASLSSGFIWACGSQCVTEAIIWSPSTQWLLVFGAALTAWWGYLMAHYASSGTFVDESSHNSSTPGSTDETAGWENQTYRRIGVVAGAGILISGMVIGVFFIRQGNHLLTNIGGVLFLGGYVIAHYVETGSPL